MLYELLAHSIRTDPASSANDRDRFLTQMVGAERQKIGRNHLICGSIVRYLRTLRHHTV
jgi:hypothetical protein